MNDAVVTFLIFWVPTVVFSCIFSALYAEAKGRLWWEGFALGLLGGFVGFIIECILPASSELDVAPLAELRPRMRAEAVRRRRIGWVVFAFLAALTALEYVAAVAIGKNVPVLVVFALPKAGLIIIYFMRISAAWSVEH